MNATALDAIFGTGFSSLKQVGFPYTLNSPATPIVNPADDVQEQAKQVDVQFNDATGKIAIQPQVGGDGLWIPYLGNGQGGPGDKGWGTYTPPVGAAIWVATGKFSGCSIGMFSGGGARRFAHVITPAAGHPCATVAQQSASVSAATGLATVNTYLPPTPAGEAIAFMLFLNGSWHKRIVQVFGDQVRAIQGRSTIF